MLAGKRGSVPLRKRTALLGVVLALLDTGCKKSSTTTSPTASTPTPAAPTVTEIFTHTLPVGGASFYSFSISVYGTVNATLLSIEGAGVPPTVIVSLGI